jgi:copper(I)-binding protein
MVPIMNHLLRQRALHIARAMALLALIGVCCALPGRTFADPPAGAKPTIKVLAAWIRWLPADLPAAGYLTLVNTGDKGLRLVAVSSPSYRDVSLHRTVTHGDVEDMVPVKEITLEPHKTLEFETTGYHLMLMQPTDSANSGSRRGAQGPGRGIDRQPVTQRAADGPPTGSSGT